MPKPMNLIPTKQLNVALPLPIYTQLVLHLTSELEGRVPHGEFSRFFSDLLRSYFEDARFDLADHIPDTPSGIYLLRGDHVTVAALKDLL